jgi:predicted RNA-binding protein associated with RNAse of E/G family
LKPQKKKKRKEAGLCLKQRTETKKITCKIKSKCTLLIEENYEYENVHKKDKEYKTYRKNKIHDLQICKWIPLIQQK